MNFEPVIGVEVHIELDTQSKMFCSCPAAHFGVEPNTHTCPVCLGLPGALPVPNRKAVEWCVMVGMALNCEVRKKSKFDRKHYFYPDLVKGYQISQYDAPFCREGFLNIETEHGSKRVGVRRVHMEEDTGKLIHRKVKGEKATLIDFNRSGVPLVEIVSEPDMRSPEQAVSFLKTLQQVVKTLAVSDCEMSEGTMRCEANVSVKKRGDPGYPSYKVEVKNLNSFRFVREALRYEIKRQTRLLEKSRTPNQETRGFDPEKKETFSQRTKEMAYDYRYFPEPDIPEIILSDRKIDSLTKTLPELPREKRQRLSREYGVSERNAFVLSLPRRVRDDLLIGDYFEKAARLLKREDTKISAAHLANVIVNKRLDPDKLSPEQLVSALVKKEKGRIKDKKRLAEVAEKVVGENREAVSDYKGGKKEAISYLLGQVMKETNGKADGETAREALVEKIKKL